MKLAIECKPFQDETLTSWIIRNAFANGTDPKSFALSVFETHSTWYKDIDRHIDQIQLKQLHKISSLSKEEILNLTLEPLIFRNTSKSLVNPFKWSFIIPQGIKGMIRTSGLYFCPECLKNNDPYISKSWKLAWVISCPVHKKILYNQCPQCNFAFSPHLARYDFPYIKYCTNCGYDLSSINSEATSNEILIFQDILTKVANQEKDTKEFPLVTFCASELFLTLEKMLSFLKYAYHREKYLPLFEFLQVSMDHKFEKGNNLTFARLNIKDREFLLIAVHRLLQLTLDEIVLHFQKLELSQTTFLKTSVYVSKTIKFILDNLDNVHINKPPRKVYKKITPKSKNEVDLLFKQLEPFIIK